VQVTLPAIAQAALYGGDAHPRPIAVQLRLVQRLFDALAELNRLRRHGAGPAHAIDAAVGAAAARREVERAVRPHVEPGHIQRPAFDKR
jgi:hypothetical protein